MAYDPADAVEDRRQRGEVAALLRLTLPAEEANVLALLGALPNADGAALRTAALTLTPGLTFDHLLALTLPAGGQLIAGSPMSVEEAFARLAAMGYEPSTPPIAFHCVEDGCHARAQLMVDRLLLLGVPADSIRRLWAFAERAFSPTAPKMLPTTEDGQPLLDWSGTLVEWDYHVAVAVVVVGPSGANEMRVIDPALFCGPTERVEWHRRTGTPTHLSLAAQTCELGVAPRHPASGQPFPNGDYRPWPGPFGTTPSLDAGDVMEALTSEFVGQGRPARPYPVLA